MKKVLIITIILVFSFGAFAQKFSGGLLIGSSIGWLNSESSSVKKEAGRFSFTWGAFVDRNLGNNFAFSTGIFINEVGGKLQYTNSIKFEYDGDNGINDVWLTENSIIKYKIRYIEIPISLKGMTNEIGHFKYHLKIGLSPMIKWKARADIETFGTNYDVIKFENRNISNEVNPFNLAFHVGGGTQFLLGGSTAIIAELIYYNGIIDTTPDDAARNNDFDILSHQIMLRLGIKF